MWNTPQCGQQMADKVLPAAERDSYHKRCYHAREKCSAVYCPGTSFFGFSQSGDRIKG